MRREKEIERGIAKTRDRERTLREERMREI